MKTFTVTFPACGGSCELFAKVFLPEGEPRGIVQFAHGMCDYGARYEHFFEKLTQDGWIAAYHDYPGHGKSVKCPEDLGFFAEKDGYKAVASAFEAFYLILEDRYPNLPHYVMGHSMGSFVVRYFISHTKQKPAGAVLMGTCGPNPLAGAGIAAANLIAKLKGPRHRSELLAKMAFGSYNKRIEDASSAWAWLSTVPATVESFDNDPLRNVTFTASGFRDLFTFVKEVNSEKGIGAVPKELPLFLLSGSEDPLGEYGEGIKKLAGLYQTAGVADVETLLVEGARHELCHEANPAAAMDAVMDWLNRKQAKEE